MEKTIWLVIPGTGDEHEAREATISPGTTAADLLREAGKDPQQWQLRLQREGGFVELSGQDDVYEKAKEGEKVYATFKGMVVG
jgi:hypothetical protein